MHIRMVGIGNLELGPSDGPIIDVFPSVLASQFLKFLSNLWKSNLLMVWKWRGHLYAQRGTSIKAAWPFLKGGSAFCIDASATKMLGQWLSMSSYSGKYTKGMEQRVHHQWNNGGWTSLVLPLGSTVSFVTLVSTSTTGVLKHEASMAGAWVRELEIEMSACPNVVLLSSFYLLFSNIREIHPEVVAARTYFSNIGFAFGEGNNNAFLVSPRWEPGGNLPLFYSMISHRVFGEFHQDSEELVVVVVVVDDELLER
ncbi:hypothetical protein Tco_0168788 [Tanacetum coccineum]